jgi:hypothetical protein
MSVRQTLAEFLRVVADEAERNPAFEAALRQALHGAAEPPRPQPAPGASTPAGGAPGKPSRAPRPAAALDPVQLARQGEAPLRSELGRLSLEQLRAILAEHGMDTGKKLARVRTVAKIVDHIVELALARAHKGDAFRD